MQNDAFTSGLQPANHYFGSLQKEANTLLKDLIKVLCTFPERVCMSSHQVLCKQAIFLKTYSENFVWIKNWRVIFKKIWRPSVALN